MLVWPGTGVSSRFTWGRKRPGTARESGLFPWPQQFVLSRTAAVPSPWQMLGTNIGVSRRTPSLQRAPSGLYLRSDCTPKWHSAAVPCVAHGRCRTKVGSGICSGGGTHRAHALRAPGTAPVGSARRLSRLASESRNPTSKAKITRAVVAPHPFDPQPSSSVGGRPRPSPRRVQAEVRCASPVLSVRPPHFHLFRPTWF